MSGRFLGLIPNQDTIDAERLTRDAAMGRGPSPWQAQITANQLALANADRLNPTLSAHNAMQTAAAQGNQMRLQEQVQAREALRQQGGAAAAGVNNLLGTFAGMGEAAANLGMMGSGAGIGAQLGSGLLSSAMNKGKVPSGGGLPFLKDIASGIVQQPGPGAPPQDTPGMLDFSGVDQAIGYDGTDPTMGLISGANAPQASQPSQSFLSALAGSPPAARRRAARPRRTGTPAMAPPTAPVEPPKLPALGPKPPLPSGMSYAAPYDPSLPMSQYSQNQSPEGVDDEALRQRLYMLRLYRNQFDGGAAPMSVQPQMYSAMPAPSQAAPQGPWSQRRGY
jgi:hypothetical protein